MFCENKIALCKCSLHLLLHFILQLRLLWSFTTLYTFACSSINLWLVHLALDRCRSISTILMNDFLPLVESFLFEFFETAEIVILNILFFVLREYYIRQVCTIDIDWVSSVLHWLEPWMVQGLLCCQPLSIIYLNKAAYEILSFIRQFFTLEIKSTFENQFM